LTLLKQCYLSYVNTINSVRIRCWKRGKRRTTTVNKNMLTHNPSIFILRYHQQFSENDRGVRMTLGCFSKIPCMVSKSLNLFHFNYNRFYDSDNDNDSGWLELRDFSILFNLISHLFAALTGKKSSWSWRDFYIPSGVCNVECNLPRNALRGLCHTF